ncbi:DNA polymerase IV [filamentous cyanobacterium LEGE 11480]|uniref:DNA polymerase IV n=1 Tax=Romeriopsis navalis LEGE 11480 TaxID=2777977 RepID=A0A928VKS9_9CYAN|nr:DNA polymerase IV [Romeriopsis navalis]MBE9029558.1 DNA polymerase IV [Romeriopsis navalis LEGE 11480]
MPLQRKIIHIDMDAFYASVEQRDNPALRGKPVAVGGSPDKRGAVAAASYEARQYGVKSAVPSRTAQQRCPQLIFVKPRFAVYREVSQQIRTIFADYTDLVEPVAFDEAYLDVTENKIDSPSAKRIAQMIRDRIFTETQLTASAGISVNKFLAKMASDLNKPNGMAVILPEQAADFVAQLPVEKFHGIGKATTSKLHDMAIFTGADLRARSEAELLQRFGKVGRFYYRIARGQDDRPVVPNRVRKSVSVETSYDPDLRERDVIEHSLNQLAMKLYDRVSKLEKSGYTLILKIKFADYQQITRNHTQTTVFDSLEVVRLVALSMLEEVDLSGKSIRLLGLGIGKLATEPQTFQQLQLDFANSANPL